MRNLISGIIYLLMVIIFCLTVYFCLDVFGIIQVPAEYSIASIFYSKIEVIASAGESYENIIIPDDIISTEQKTVIIPTPKQDTESRIDFDEAIAKLNEANNRKEDATIPEDSIIDADNLDPNKFYYNQLDQYAKILYSELYKNKENLKTGTYTVDYGRTFNDLLNTEGGTQILNNDFQLAINALTFDNPDLFYLDVTEIYLLTEIITRPFSKTYNVSIGANGGNYLMDSFENEEILDNAIKEVQMAKNKVVEQPFFDEFDKIKTAHDYLVENVEYSGGNPQTAYSVYGALVEGKSVCEGYARAFKLMLDELDVPCIIVCGIAKNSEGETESHAWNYVYINDDWYAIDVTWDDPVIVGTGRVTDSIKYAYFLKGSNKFFEDHLEDGNIVGEASFIYPKISVINYR